VIVIAALEATRRAQDAPRSRQKQVLQTIVSAASIDGAVPNHERRPVSITLSPVQVDAVVRAAAQGRTPRISALIADSLHAANGDPALADLDRVATGSAPLADRSVASPPATASARRAASAERESGGLVPSDLVDRRLSRSLLRGLSLLRCFRSESAPRGIVELARELEMSPSTAHRYALTLVELGLLERCPRTRKYRLPDS
jgi:IclR helix-turn-helix domain